LTHGNIVRLHVTIRQGTIPNRQTGFASLRELLAEFAKPL
jgi:hypothetical protein